MSINCNNKNKLGTWIRNLNKKNSKNVLLVYGKSGLGKYTTVYEVLAEQNYDIHTFHSIDFMNKKDIKMQIAKMVKNRSIYMMINKNKSKNAIIIKELEAFNKPHNLKLLEDIINTYFKDNDNNIPLICIASGDFFKKFRSLEKITDQINFKKTSNVNFKKYIQNKCKQNNLNIETKLVNYIVKKLDGNIRQFNNIFDYMVNNPIKKYKYNNFQDIINMISSNENNEIELYELIFRILNDRSLDINTIINFFNVEKIFVPFMLYQNFKQKLFYKNPNKLEEYNKIMNSYSNSDIIHKYIFDLHYWELQKSYCILSCYYPYHIFKKYRKKVDLKNIKFTSVLNKNSLKYATYLNCNKIMRNCKQPLMFDDTLLTYYCKYISFFLMSKDTDQQEKGIDLLVENNFQISDVGKIIKFSNYHFSETDYNKKIYNKLKKIYKKKYEN